MDKDPQAKLDYGVEWSSWLGTSETISTSTWTVPTGITQISPAPSITGSRTTIWLGGGTVGSRYDVVNHIVTNQARENEQTITIVVVDK